MKKLTQLIGSRKFWAAVVAILISAVGDRAGIDEAMLTDAVHVCIAYILGTALEDGAYALGALGKGVK